VYVVGAIVDPYDAEVVENHVASVEGPIDSRFSGVGAREKQDVVDLGNKSRRPGS
jgi:hypothetical protein